MDRDNNWDREEKAYAAFVYGEGKPRRQRPGGHRGFSYAADVTDEFVVPVRHLRGRPGGGAATPSSS